MILIEFLTPNQQKGFCFVHSANKNEKTQTNMSLNRITVGLRQERHLENYSKIMEILNLKLNVYYLNEGRSQ